LREAEELAQQESARAAEAVRQMELSQRHEADEAAALEKMVQKVESNLETATQRALHSETVVAKLKQEVRTLQSRVELLETENATLRSRTVSDSVSMLRDRAVDAAHQINTAATDAEQLLKRLLAGVDKLRIVSEILASTDKVADLPPEGNRDGGDSDKK
jgi:DNA repair exonuclease SbcCD ATPase subunit